jgi:hypothetical protein
MHLRRFDDRVLLEAAPGVGAQRRGSGVGPDVGAPPTFSAELDIVGMRGRTGLEDRQQFMARAVEAAHPGAGFGPHEPD